MSRFGELLKKGVFGGSGSSVSFGTPTQSYTDLTGNKNMDWTAGVVAGNWVLVNGTVGGNPGISEVAPGGGAGNGAVRFLNTAGAANAPRLRLTATINTYIDAILTVSQRTSGTLYNVDQPTAVGAQLSSVATARGLFRVTAGGASIGLYTGGAGTDAVVDYAEDNLITVNPEFTAPSANMRITWKFTPPASPVSGSQYWGIARSSNFSSGNYLFVLLTYTGSQWNVTLYKVATFTRTATAAAATNIGSCNGIRVNFNGNLLDLETTANDGGTWTARGSQVNDATYNTATGVNALWTSDFTAGNIQYNVPI